MAHEIALIAAGGCICGTLNFCFWFLQWRHEGKWKHVGADTARWCAKKTQQSAAFALLMGVVAMIFNAV